MIWCNLFFYLPLFLHILLFNLPQLEKKKKNCRRWAQHKLSFVGQHCSIYATCPIFDSLPKSKSTMAENQPRGNL